MLSFLSCSVYNKVSALCSVSFAIWLLTLRAGSLVGELLVSLLSTLGHLRCNHLLRMIILEYQMLTRTNQMFLWSFVLFQVIPPFPFHPAIAMVLSMTRVLMIPGLISNSSLLSSWSTFSTLYQMSCLRL